MKLLYLILDEIIPVAACRVKLDRDDWCGDAIGRRRLNKTVTVPNNSRCIIYSKTV